jgi:phosphohistidine phosphatase SixA
MAREGTRMISLSSLRAAALAVGGVCAGLLAGTGSAWAQAAVPFTSDGRAAAQEVSRAAKPAPQSFQEKLATANTLNQLRAGGFVLYIRHGQTDNDRTDKLPVNLADCTSQRPLNEAGRLTMRRVGEALRRAQIPISQVRVSPMCRTLDSAEAAFPNTPLTIDRNLMYVANYTDAEKAPILANTLRWLAQPTTVGRNRVLVGHGPNLMDLIGYFPKEATVTMFRPLGGERFEYVATIPSDLWSRLAAP